MALIVFAITLFTSAFLLFLVQPVIGKFILPALGGTPQVWNTCMMFFQTVLLTGYFYTHAVTTRFPLRRQIVTHVVLLALPLVAIFGYMAWAPASYPFDIRNWTPPPGVNPIGATLKLLAITVGIPFFVVSTSAPLLQKWFASTGDPSANDPYFLSVASNVGSLSSLLLYPVLIEPYQERSEQTWMWTIGFMVMIALFLYAASMVWNAKPKDEALSAAEPPPAPGPAEPEMAALAIQAATAKMGIKPGKGNMGAAAVIAASKSRDISVQADVGGGDIITFWRCLHWILLAAVPSSLMLGVISYVSVDLSPFPLLWVVPLSLYLMSFILVFVKDTRYGLIALGLYFLYIAAFILIYFHSWLFAGALFGGATVSLLASYLINGRMPWTAAPHRVCIFLSLIGVIAMSVILQRGGFNPVSGTAICFVGFFLVALVCHGEMAKDRPSVTHLTLFFLMMSVGGMVGGVFNGLLAPVLFKDVLEFPIAIVLACFLHPSLNPIGWLDQIILDNNPKMRNNLTKTGNEWAKAVGMIPPNRPYPLSWAIDVAAAALVVLFAWALKTDMFGGWVRSLTKAFVDEQADHFDDWQTRIYILLVIVPPLVAAVAMSGRGMRYGLAMLGIFVLHYMGEGRGNSERVIYADRSYFGVLKVYSDNSSSWLYRSEDGFHGWQETRALRDAGQLTPEEAKDIATVETLSLKGKRMTDRDAEAIRQARLGLGLVANKLMHGTTHHGLNFQDPRLSRLATTYYHRFGPVGAIMEQYNWFPGKQNTYHADARLPASVVGAMNPFAAAPLAVEALTALQTEPPIAVIGLGTGTMASYGRPFGHVTYYEIDEKIRNMSLPPDSKKRPYFNYLRDAEDRGCNVEVIMGDARLSMEGRREKAREEERLKMSDEERARSRVLMQQARDGYYKVIVVDAFSSDAIPIHLITKEAIELYLSKLAPDGVLCVHTSNRHMTLINPVSDIASKLGCQWLVGTDSGNSTSMGHFPSEYIMVVHPRPKDYRYMDFAKWMEKSEAERGPYGHREWGGWLFPVLRAGGPFIDPPNYGPGPDYVNWLKENDERIKKFSKKLRPPPEPEGLHVNDVIEYRNKRWRPEYEKHRAANRAVRQAVFPHLANLFDWYDKIHPEQRLWTDDYSNILAVLHRGSRGQQEEPNRPYPDFEMKAATPATPATP